uniref:Protein kinase domain-containing protein n=1 Tax=Oryza meridionalis TaxID=40149 RepID=A0A0E0EPB6_9ORYZ
MYKAVLASGRAITVKRLSPRRPEVDNEIRILSSVLSAAPPCPRRSPAPPHVLSVLLPLASAALPSPRPLAGAGSPSSCVHMTD